MYIAYNSAEYIEVPVGYCAIGIKIKKQIKNRLFPNTYVKVT